VIPWAGTQRCVRKIDVKQEHRGNIEGAAAGVISFSSCGRFLFAFANSIAVAFNDGHVGVVKKTVEHGDDAGGIGKDLVPLFEWPVGREDHRFAFVAAIDDFVEQIGGLVVGGKIPDFIDAKDASVGVAAQFAAAAIRRLTL